MAGENFVVYKSSAGSGKTFTLVREYLKIILKDPDQFRHVLAITFTNKAANEMKERVVRYLVALQDPARRKNEPAIRQLLGQLTDFLRMSEDQVAERASKALQLIMHNYGEFAISTIDSFTHRVIRTFSHDLNIPMNFEVELDTDVVLEEAVDELISMAGTDPGLTRVLVDFVENKAGDEKSWKIEKDLFDFGKALLSEDSIPFLEELRKYDLDTFMEVRKRIFASQTGIRQQARDLARKAIAIAEKAGIEDEYVHYKSKGVLKFLRSVEGDGPALDLPNSYARHSLQTGQWLGGKVPPAVQAAFDAVESDLVPIGEALLELLDKEYPVFALGQLLLKNLFATALLGEIEKILDKNCREENKVLINEFNRRISAVVREQPAPFIYERLGERYQHYLIDEFQDTSVMQWHNLLPLIENALASYRLNLVVGDAKQAIYRWRSGDARQFELLPMLLSDRKDPLLASRERVLVDNFKEEDLSMNHRSSPVIVNFNNDFFSSVIPLLPEVHRGLYEKVAQQPAKKDKPGLVHIEIARKEDDSDTTSEQLTHDKILEFITELHSDGYPLSDIAILCRKNEMAANIAAYLISRDISVISEESLLLTQSDNVNFFLAWARHLTFNEDGLPVSNILFYLVTRGFLPVEDFEKFYLDAAPGPKKEVVEESGKPGIGFSGLLEHYLEGFEYRKLKNLDVQGLFRYLAHYFKLDLNTDSYLRFFMDYVLEFTRRSHGGVPGFLEWWEDKSDKASIVIPEGINAVRIMTIHKAKGLQFPAVIYPFADENSRPSKNNLWVHLEDDLARPLRTAYLPVQKSLEGTTYEPQYREEIDLSAIDLVNVLYVALTRPEERLYVITGSLPDKTDGPVSVPKFFSYYFKEKGIYEEGRTSYLFGERWIKEQVVADEGMDVEPVEPFYGKDSLRLLLRKHAPFSWEMDEPDGSRQWGIMVHSLLSGVRIAGDIGPVIENLLSVGDITRHEAGKLKGLMEDLMKDPVFGVLFDPEFEIYNEAEILSSDGHSYRPDRVMVQGRKARLFDYKTGTEKERHRAQLNAYCDLLRQMGYEVEGAWLVYLNDKPVLVRVV